MKSSLYALLLLLPSIAVAQVDDADVPYEDTAAVDIDFVATAKGNRVELGVGPGHIASRDELGSPLTYSNIGAELVLRYEYVGEAHRHLIGVGYDGNGVAPSPLTSVATDAQSSTHTSSYTFVTAYYGYLWQVGTFGGFALHAGPKLEWVHFERQYDYNSFLAETSWETMITADLNIRLEYPIDKRQEVTLGASTGTVGVIERPPYSLHGIESAEGMSRVVTLGPLLKVAASIAYNYHIASDFYLSIHSDFLYYRFDEPLPTATVMQGVGFVFGLKL